MDDNKNESIVKFASIIKDFCGDLTITFPDFAHLWVKFQTDDEEVMKSLYDYCIKVYPERFFDILYQNSELFSEKNDNTFFLPGVDFKILFSCPDISENTRKTMWKYLQLILITIMGDIQSSSSFGEAASIFEGIDETELQNKLSETIGGLSEFFNNITGGSNEEGEEKEGEGEKEEGEKEEGEGKEEGHGFDFSSMPNVDELQDHLKGLFDGKIGSLAKELAEELSGDVMDMFSGENTTSADIMKEMMKDPKQIMELVKKISAKLDTKMKDGDISQEELMKEAGEIFSKFKGSGNEKDFQNMMKGMMKNMNPMMASMMGGKGGKFDMNKMQNQFGKMSHREKMKQKLEERRAKAQAQAQFNLQQTETPNEYVFKGTETQEKSSARPPNDDWLCETPEPTKSHTTKNKKKGKKK